MVARWHVDRLNDPLTSTPPSDRWLPSGRSQQETIKGLGSAATLWTTDDLLTIRAKCVYCPSNMHLWIFNQKGAWLENRRPSRIKRGSQKRNYCLLLLTFFCLACHGWLVIHRFPCYIYIYILYGESLSLHFMTTICILSATRLAIFYDHLTCMAWQRHSRDIIDASNQFNCDLCKFKGASYSEFTLSVQVKSRLGNKRPKIQICHESVD